MMNFYKVKRLWWDGSGRAKIKSGSILFTLTLCLVIISCQPDDFTEPLGTNNAPTAEIIAPGDTVVVVETFPVAADFRDNTPGLSEAIFTIVDSIGSAVFDTAIVLIGTRDSIGFMIGPDRLLEGLHTLQITVEDTEGLGTTASSEFFGRGFASVQSQMFILGSMNGWGGTDLQMKLIADNTWEVKDVEITADDAFKFVNTPDFSDTDWTDPECDGVADVTGGAENIDCGFNGTFDFTFNDLTFEYSAEGEAIFTANNDQMFVLGSMNGWGGTDLQMTLVDNNLWEVEGVELLAEDENNGGNPSQFKFANTPDFSDADWGDDGGCDGTAEPSGANIDCGFVGPFTIQFNDETLEYRLLGDFNANNDQMFVLGSMNGWGGTDLQMTLVDDFTWEVNNVEIVSDDGFKFANTPDFTDTDWGDDGCDGVASDSEGDILCNFAGTLKFTFNDESLEYSVE